MQSNNNPSRLSDDELVAEVERLARCEREATAQLIVYLVELDERRLYLGAGFSSLFTCCTEVLKVSEHETYQRIAAARTSRRCPVLLRMLAEGSLNLTSVRLPAPRLNEDNQERHRRDRRPGSDGAPPGPGPREIRRDRAAACKSRPANPPSGSRHIPAEVKRAVWVRDLGRCAFVSENGRPCNERGFVEFHHVQPYAAGGPATAENIQLRCRAHNGYEADLYFGPGSRPPGSATRPGPSCVPATQPHTDSVSRPG